MNPFYSVSDPAPGHFFDDEGLHTFKDVKTGIYLNSDKSCASILEPLPFSNSMLEITPLGDFGFLVYGNLHGKTITELFLYHH